jgi:uncharacterized membrane protein
VPIKGVHDQLGANFDLLGDHFHPILAALSPTYWVWPHPEVLLVDQALLLAISIVPIWHVVFRAHGRTAANFMSIGYALFWGLQTTVIFDFHELAFAVPILAFALNFADRGKWRNAAVVVSMLLLVKEDLAFVVVFFGIYAVIKGEKRLGARLALIGAVSYELITRVIMPAFGHHVYLYWFYSELGTDIPSALLHLASHPVEGIKLLVSPIAKVKLWVMLMVPFLGLPLVSPATLLAIPLLAERLYSTDPNHWATHFHYNAPFAPILVIAASNGMSQICRYRPSFGRMLPRVVPVAMLLLALYLSIGMPFRQLISKSTWTGSETQRAVIEALREIPSGAKVEASNRLVPQLMGRTDVVLVDGVGHPDVSWSAVLLGDKEWPFDEPQQQQVYVDGLIASGWHVVVRSPDVAILSAPKYSAFP